MTDALTPINKLYEVSVIAEVDDYTTAKEILTDTYNIAPEFKMERLALWVARLRERFIQIGRELGPEK